MGKDEVFYYNIRVDSEAAEKEMFIAFCRKSFTMIQLGGLPMHFASLETLFR